MRALVALALLALVVALAVAPRAVERPLPDWYVHVCAEVQCPDSTETTEVAR